MRLLPTGDGQGGLTLENCPFHALATRHTPLVCAANLALVEGVVEATGDDRMPSLEPAPGRCCVALHQDRARTESSDDEGRDAVG